MGYGRQAAGRFRRARRPDAARFLLALPSSTIDVDVDDELTIVDLAADDRAKEAAGWTLSIT
jgi:hypothetical protein